jgi:hypothetical protein
VVVVASSPVQVSPAGQTAWAPPVGLGRVVLLLSEAGLEPVGLVSPLEPEPPVGLVSLPEPEPPVGLDVSPALTGQMVVETGITSVTTTVE